MWHANSTWSNWLNLERAGPQLTGPQAQGKVQHGQPYHTIGNFKTTLREKS